MLKIYYLFLSVHSTNVLMPLLYRYEVYHIYDAVYTHQFLKTLWNYNIRNIVIGNNK